MNDSLDQTLIFPPHPKRPKPIVSDSLPAHTGSVLGCPRWCNPNDPCNACQDRIDALDRAAIAQSKGAQS